MRSNIRFQVGLLGTGSWATALAKILTDNHFRINWLVPKPEDVAYLRRHRRPPRYLTTVQLDMRKIRLFTDASQVTEASDWLVIATPSVYAEALVEPLAPAAFTGKYVVSGIKGILPGPGLLLNDYLHQRFGLDEAGYFAITGPCHAEEVAAEKLSYITISGADARAAAAIAKRFTTPYLKTIVNDDLRGAQYAAVLKNIYAIGAGIAHGLGFGDNFLAVYTANCAAELAMFCRTLSGNPGHPGREPNAFASAYLGDLLVTCYSQYSRNRLLGQMIGKGYGVAAALVEMNMVAEGYHAARSIHRQCLEQHIAAPVATAVYRILWEGLPPADAFAKLKRNFV